MPITIQSFLPQHPNHDLASFQSVGVKEKKEGLLGKPYFFHQQKQSTHHRIIFPDPTTKPRPQEFPRGCKREKGGFVILSFSVSKAPSWPLRCYREGMRRTFLTLYIPRSWKSQKQTKPLAQEMSQRNKPQQKPFPYRENKKIPLYQRKTPIIEDIKNKNLSITEKKTNR